jgi:hypothetical protein
MLSMSSLQAYVRTHLNHVELSATSILRDLECELERIVDEHILAKRFIEFLSGTEGRFGAQTARLILQVRWKGQKINYLDVGRTRTYAPEGN